MGSDGHKESSRRKHRRSSPLSDEDAERSSKKHKHRHHRRHRKKREDETETETRHEGDERGELNDDSPSPVPPLRISSYQNPRPDDDVEEGEILEEDGMDEFKSQNLVHDEEGRVKVNKSPGETVNGFYSKDDQDRVLNGGLDVSSGRNDDREKLRSPSVDKVRGSSHQSAKKVEEGSNLSDGKKHSKSIEDAHKTSHNRYEDDTDYRARSRSRDVGRERSRSRSIMLDEELNSERRDHLERDSKYLSERRKADFDLDHQKVTYHRRDWRHSSRDSVRDEERERVAGYSRYNGREERLESRERKSRDKYVVRDDDVERRRDGERRREGNYTSKDERERSIDRDYRKRSEQERSYDRESERNNRRSSRRERSQERELGRERRMEKEREASRDRAWELEKIRDRDRDRVRDNDRDRRLEEDRLDGRNKSRSMDVSSWKSKYENSEYEQDKHRDSKYSRPSETDKRKREESSKIEVLDSDDEHKRDENEQDFEEAFALKPAEEEEEDLNRIKEESRRLRQAIMEKYRNKQQQQRQQQQEQQVKPPAEDIKEKEHLENPSEVIELPVAVEISGRTQDGDGNVAEPSISIGKSTPENGIAASARTTGAAGLGEGTPKSERSDDMFCDDIFGDSPAGRRKLDKGGSLPIERGGLHDNWDDAEGYYSYRFGEILDGRYEVIAAHGKGVFSAVVRAKDLKAGPGDPEEVAIKILRNKEAMYKAGVEELGILNKLVGADPEDKRHCVRLYSSFKYRNHLCLVFESLNMNLREVLKKFGRNIGLKLTAVRAYAKQLFIALKHLRNCGVLHCDIKPDNMLVNEAKNVLKLCDFGNAMFAGKNEITPYLVSRFYRAPEIILGLPYDHPMDIWSVGCCLYELYTGKVLFPGPTNNDMLRLHMELKGPFPKKMLRKGAFTDQHFDQDLNFLSTEEDPVTKKTMKRMIVNIRPKDIGLIIKGSAGEDPKMLANFKDLLDKIFVLDPEKRMTVQQALSHPFITGK